MIQGITTSIRLPSHLRDDLEEAAHSLHRGKNWIIKKALEEYLERLHRHNLAEEARRQSLIVAKAEANGDDDYWERLTDTTGWE